MSEENFAILIIGYDGYSSLWDPFFKLMKKNWPDCPYNIYLATNEMAPQIDGVTVITTKKEYQWSLKVRDSLQKIEEKYVYMLLEDFFICYPVDSQEVERLFSYVYENEICYVKTPYKGAEERKRPKFKNNSCFYQIYKNQKYGISLLPGIWEKSFLLRLLGNKDYNPWKFEVDRINEAKKAPNEPFENCFVYNKNPLNIYNGVIQGKYVPDTYRRILKQGIELKQGRITKMDVKTRVMICIKRIGIKLIPLWLEPSVKIIVRKLGVTFVSDSNDN